MMYLNATILNARHAVHLPQTTPKSPFTLTISSRHQGAAKQFYQTCKPYAAAATMEKGIKLISNK
jgi:hypothetical protein